jgi:CheY-like chemotaxis protein
MYTSPTRAKQVLIVDDDPQTSDGLSLVLEAAGYTARTAANGAEALNELRQWRPDYILLDLAMPVMDGWTFRAQQLRDPKLADIPVVVLSGHGEGGRREADRLGVSRCLRRPTSGDAVLDVVSELVGVLEDGRP